MPRTVKVQPDNGVLFPDGLSALEAKQYLEKQLSDLQFAATRLSEMIVKLDGMHLETDGPHIDVDWIIEPTNHIRVCTGLKLTVKL